MKSLRRRWSSLAFVGGVVSDRTHAAPADEADIIGVLHAHIQHVIYIVKDGRTFDEVLSDMTNGANADPSLAQFGRHITPNAHRIAANFVAFVNGDRPYPRLRTGARMGQQYLENPEDGSAAVSDRHKTVIKPSSTRQAGTDDPCQISDRSANALLRGRDADGYTGNARRL